MCLVDNGHKQRQYHTKGRRSRGQRQNAKLRLLQQQQLQMLQDITYLTQQRVENEQQLSYKTNQVAMIRARQLEEHRELELLQ